MLGGYEHGSAVLGGVQATSDIDILVVTRRLATLVEKRQLVEGLMAISAPFPPPGPERCVEVTVVAQPQVPPWRYPPSVDLQYGEWLRERFERGDGRPLQAAVNVDLTTLLTHRAACNQPLFGPPPRALLDPVLMEDCIRAMVGDIDVLMDEFDADTRNILLTLARIWQTVVTGVIDRKDRAAEWAGERLPPGGQPFWSGHGASTLAWSPADGLSWHPEARTTAESHDFGIRQEAAPPATGPGPRLAEREQRAGQQAVDLRWWGSGRRESNPHRELGKLEFYH